MKTYKTRGEMIADLPAFSIAAEIGVQRGDFAAELLAIPETPLACLHLVDCWRHRGAEYAKDPADLDDGGHETNHRHVLNRFLKEIAQGQVVVHREMSVEAARRFRPASLDFVYVDAGHSFEDASSDLNAWAPKICSGGAILGHDYVDNDATRAMGFGVVKAVDEFCRANGWEVVGVTEEEFPSYMLKRI